MKKYVACLGIIAFLLASCSNLISDMPEKPGDEAEPSSTTGATGSLTISTNVPEGLSQSGVESMSARGLTIASVKVTLSRENHTDVVVNLSYTNSSVTATGSIEGLDLGTWIVVGVAADAFGNPLYSGQSEVTIEAGNNTVNLDLVQDSGGIKVNLNWGAAYPYTTLSVTASRTTFPSVMKTVTLSGSISTFPAYLMNLTKGDWNVTADLYLNSVKYFTYAGTVTVDTGTVVTLNGEMTPLKAAPVRSDPEPGSYAGSYAVALSCTTAGASIRYTTDGNAPTSSSGILYSSSAPIELTADTIIKAIAYVPDSVTVADSDVVTFDFKVKTASPMPNVAPGTYSHPFALRLNTVIDGATIRYTLDGTTPSKTNGCIYSDAIPIWVSQSSVGVRAVAIKSGNTISDVSLFNYSVTHPELVEVVPIAGGSFNNGSATMTVSPFYMSKYEITQLQYATAMNTISGGNGDTYPVNYINWYQAVEICNALSDDVGLDRVYSINYTGGSDLENLNGNDSCKYLVTADFSRNGYRLPTEAEWEYAYRAGTTTNYYWGSLVDVAYAWFGEGSWAICHPVGEKKGNAWGLYDMSGNASEWCWDWNSTYPTVAKTDYRGPSSGSERIYRGGGYQSDSSGCTASSRGFLQSDYTYNYMGLRVVRRP